MLNLTDSPITLIAESGKTTTLEASGYVERVETTRRRTISSGILESFDGNMRLTHLIPIIEETPTEIIVESEFWGGTKKLGDGMREDDTNEEGWFGVGNDQLLIVTREVAEAAATLKHPLCRRMVWADSPEHENQWRCVICREVGLPWTHVTYQETHDTDCRGKVERIEVIIGYRALRCVPQGESHA
jgi:hypothetical protein